MLRRKKLHKSSGGPGSLLHKKSVSAETDCGTSMGTRTPVFAVRGRRLNRLTMEAYWLPN